MRATCADTRFKATNDLIYAVAGAHTLLVFDELPRCTLVDTDPASAARPPKVAAYIETCVARYIRMTVWACPIGAVTDLGLDKRLAIFLAGCIVR